MSKSLLKNSRFSLVRWALMTSGLLAASAIPSTLWGQEDIAPPVQTEPALPQQVQLMPSASEVKFNVRGRNERMELTVNESRVVDFPFEVPKMLLNNPDLVKVVPISPTSVQISAIKPGVTQLNVWNAEDKVTSIDMIIVGDVKELEMTLKSLFPDCDIRLRPLANGLYMSGFVPKAETVAKIERVAKTFFPEIINDLTVGGVHKVQLHVKVMEVSRTKLRDQGFDWQQISAGGSYVGQNAAGLLGAGGAVNTSANAANIQFGIVDGSNRFYGFLQFLQRKQLAKLLSEPTLTTVSGRPASFNSGGQIPIAVPQALGVTTIEYREFGTQIDFVPVILGNGNIRLEVLAQVTEIDPSLAVAVGTGTVPGFRSRRADTAMEMKAGQTMAIAGLVYNRLDSQVRGVPVLSDLPWAGAAFRRNTETNNEVELIIMVTPEFTEAMDATEVPPCGPGQLTTSPTDGELYIRGYQEVPKAGCINGNCAPGANGAAQGFNGPAYTGQDMQASSRRNATATGADVKVATGSNFGNKNTKTTSNRTALSTTRTAPISGASGSVSDRNVRPTSTTQPSLIGPQGYDSLR